MTRIWSLLLIASLTVGAAQHSFVTTMLPRGDVAAARHASPLACDSLASISLAHVTIASARVIAAGTFAPAGAGATAPYRGLPAFCRVVATVRPTPESEIAIEVWAPAANWNGKFAAVGNGAFSGSIPTAAMASVLARGYAVASTNTGHNGGSAHFALESRDKVVDFGWRAVHEMTVVGKALVTAFYGNAPAHAYWDGCSAGGRQALMEAQRFPMDFDGIIAGSPGLDWTGRASQAVRVARALEPHADARLGAAARTLLHGAVVSACDALDGVRDGLIDDPRRCNFDPGILECRDAARADCLTTAQVATARLIYSPMLNRTTGRQVPGLSRGSELGWTDLGWTASARATGLDQFRYIVMRDSAWTIDRFRADVDVARAESDDEHTLNAMDPSLRPFFDRGGKLIQYHGWSDPQIAPASSVQYYESVLAVLGSGIDAAYRLFMVPGMGHCGGGEGPSVFDMMAALERWVERQQPPDQILASHVSAGAVDRTRPLCPYPRRAVYRGTGSIDDAASFECRAP